MSTPHLTAALCSILIPAGAAVADDAGADWPHWRGPDRTGVSAETGWSAVSRDEPLWKRHIGFGHSSFAVSNGRLFAMGYDVDAGHDVIYCLDPTTGEEKWTHTYPAEFWNEGHDGGTCTTPAVDGNTVYASNREGKLMALRADTGSVLWTRDMKADLNVTPPRWGFSGSPVVVGDHVIANIGPLAAFDKTTGELVWKSEREIGNAYSTPIEYDFKGRPAMLVLNGLGLAVIDRTDGSEITFHEWTRNPERAIYGATPVIVDGKIFISAGSGPGCAMLEPDADGTGLDIVWEGRAMRSSYAGAVLYEDHLYGFDASMLKCIDLEGNQKWRERGIGLGAMVVVGGRLLIISAKGELIIAEANPEAYVELSRTKVLDGGACWSTPVLSHGLAYARNSLGDMVCCDYRASSATHETTARMEVPADLPEASSLLAKHVEAIGGAEALRGLTSAHFTGSGESHGGGPIEHCDAQMTWSAAGGFVWRFSSGLDFGYNTEMGWGPGQGGPSVFTDEQIATLKENGDLHRMLQPDWGYTSLQTVETRVFDDRPCYVVSAEHEDGNTRTLYFEVDSGLLAGQEREDKPLWVFDDYATAGGVKLPMEWSFFAAESGSMTLARFSHVDVHDVDPAHLEPPKLIRMLTWSDGEKRAENTRLREAHGSLIGKYQLATGSMVGTPMSIAIEDGGIKLAFGPGPGQFLTEPDEEGRLFIMSQPQIYIQVDTTDDGGREIVAYAYGDEFGKLERVPTEPSP